MTTPGAATAQPLYRDRSDAKLAGVCAAFARHTGTDPVIWRITTVVLAVFGGAGAVLYLLGWLLVPQIGEDGSIAERWVHRRDGGLSRPVIALLAVAAVLVLGLDDGRSGVSLAVIALVGYLVYRERSGSPLVPSYTGPVTPAHP